jgi:hypothetical protein
MQAYLNEVFHQQITVADAATAIDCELGGYSRFSMIIPAALNGLTATFQVYDQVAAAWITTAQTQVLATGYWVPSASQLAALCMLNKFRMSLSGPSVGASVLQFIKKT